MKEKIKTISRFRKEQYVDSLTKEEQRELAIERVGSKPMNQVLSVYIIFLFLVMFGFAYLATTIQIEHNERMMDRTNQLSSKICEVKGEEYIGYYIVRTSNELMIECESSKLWMEVK